MKQLHYLNTLLICCYIISNPMPVDISIGSMIHSNIAVTIHVIDKMNTSAKYKF